jgi:hypothetical protein
LRSYFFFETIWLRFREGLAPTFFGVLFLLGNNLASLLQRLKPYFSCGLISFFETIWLRFGEGLAPAFSWGLISLLKQFGFTSMKA